MARAGKGILKYLLGKRGEDLWKELNGESIDLIRSANSLPKSISKSQTFLEFTCDRKVIYGFLIDLLMQATVKLRRYHLAARRLGLFLRTKQFEVISDEYKLPTFHCDDAVFITYARLLFERLYKPGVVFRSGGVWLTDFVWQTGTQLSLFGDEQDQPELMRVLDCLNQRYGPGAVTRASTLFHRQPIHEKWMGSSFEHG